jgi:4-amino-4-deoxy-L-arabinose transferase-like glycosyltransferase
VNLSGMRSRGLVVPHGLILLGLASAALILTLLAPAQVTDDAYITYRYVRNITAGDGFVYNRGERVLGTTTPLYTLLLAALTYVVPHSDIIQLSLMVNAICDALSTIVLFQLCHWISRNKWAALVAAVLFACFPFRLAIARTGMETPFFVLTILTSIYMYILERPSLSAAIAGLAALVRPEGGFLVAIILAHLSVSRRRPPWKESAVIASVLLPWFLFSTWYFGSPVPNSVIAKARAYVMLSRLEFFPIAVRFWGGSPFWGQQTVPRLVYALLNGVFLVSLYLLVLRLDWRSGSKAVVFWLYPVVFVLAFAFANPFIMPWHLAPLLPFWLVALAKGIITLVKVLAKHLPDHRRRLLVTGALLAIQIPALDIVTEVRLGAPLSQREDLYRALAVRLRKQVSGNSVIAASEIGTLGYYSSAYILDTVGLVSPQAIPYNPAARSPSALPYAIPTQLILDHRPQLVVSLEIFARGTLLQSDEFSEAYNLAERIDTAAFGSNGLLVFRRRD